MQQQIVYHFYISISKIVLRKAVITVCIACTKKKQFHIQTSVRICCIYDRSQKSL